MLVDRIISEIGPFVERGEVPGAIVGVWRGGELAIDAVGTAAFGDDTPLRADTPVRASSNTKPITAAVTMSLVEEGVFDLHDPVEKFVPELAARTVVRQLDADLDDTVPVERPVTVEDLLSMRLGFGFVVEGGDCPVLSAAADAQLGIGPPDPSVPLDPDAWIARFAKLPLLEQPGTVWRYDLAYGVLGVFLARAGKSPLDRLFAERLLDPLGMAETGFVAPPGQLPPCYASTESGVVVFDESNDSRWSVPPDFPDARGGLVSTAADLLRFAAALLHDGGGVLSADSVAAMATDHLTTEQRRGPSAQAFLDGGGWGYGVQVLPAGTGSDAGLPRYGWGGGLGTLWYSWPSHNTAAVLLTQVMPPSAGLITAFISGVESDLDHR